YQSYQACAVLRPVGTVTAVQVPDARRQSLGVPLCEAQAYATDPFEGAMLTASLSNTPVLPGSATTVQLAPPSVDRHSPSLDAARISDEAAPEGAIAMAQVVAFLRCVQL